LNAEVHICNAPKRLQVLNGFIDKIATWIEQVQLDKENHMDEWKQCNIANFTKSLDHRAFFFKES